MKKDTLSGWIYRQREHISRKEKNEVLRTAKLAALKQCEDWLFARTWATMREPVQHTCTAIAAEVVPLLETQKTAVLTEEDTTRLSELRASGEIYELFLARITPTARQAEWDRHQRQGESTRRSAFRQAKRT